MKTNLKKLALATIAACVAPMVFAQTGVTLKIGDPAPQLKVSTWVKGTPTVNFDANHIYVVEFWATWCGPCRQMMPHLSEMAKKYAGKVTFDSCDVWENSESKTPLSPDEVLAKVKQFVADMGDKMAYNIASDTADGYMATNWMQAAGQNGIPTAFLIKGGQVIWIGHPYVIEKTIDQVLAGTYDEAAYAKEFAEKTQKNALREAAWKAVTDPVKKAMEAKDYAKAVELADAGAKSAPEMKGSLYVDKFNALLAMDPAKALDFVRQWHKDQPDWAIHAVNECADQDGLPADVYRLGVSYAQEETTKDGYLIPLCYDTMAKFYFKLGDVSNAIASEEKAIDLGNKAMKSGQYSGRLLASDMKRMQDTLDRYKASQH